MYDVIVCGAGCAGFCAAVAAARMGARTALEESGAIVPGKPREFRDMFPEMG